MRPQAGQAGRRRRGGHARGGFTLWELFMVLLLVGVVAGLVAWGLIAQLDTDRRLIVQSNRQGVLQAVMHQLRVDMAQATAVHGGSDNRPDGSVDPASAASDTPSDSVRLQTPTGDVRYYVDTPAPPNGEHGVVSGGPVDATLVRIDASGAEKCWRLYGQTMRLQVARSGAALLNVIVESGAGFATGHRRLRRFDTTLYVGQWR